MKPVKLVLFMEGGLIHSAISDANVQMLIADSDLEGVDDSEITRIPALEETVDYPYGETYLTGVSVDSDPALLEAVFEADRKRFEEVGDDNLS